MRFLNCHESLRVRRPRWRRFVWLLAGMAGAVLRAADQPPAAAATNAWDRTGYAYFCETDPKIPSVAHVVKVDRAQKDLRLHTTLGGGEAIGMALVSQQVKFLPPEKGRAVAAINGDYFLVNPPYVGDPMGLQIIDGELVSGPCLDRACAYFDAAGAGRLTNFISRFRAVWPSGKEVPIGLNEICAPNKAVLYNRAAGPATRQPGFFELLLGPAEDGPWLPLRLGQVFKARVRQVNPAGQTPLGNQGLVLAIGGKLAAEHPPPVVGDTLKFLLEVSPEVKDATLAIGGGPSLVQAGKPRVWDAEGARHPRSAFGWNENYFFLVTVDGRQPKHSMGMSYGELARFMAKLGCDYALNLDGGGSAEMWLEGRVISRPSNGQERPAANAIVLARQPKPPKPALP